MSIKYELLLLDIDGTLVRSKPDALPTRRVIEAVRSATDNFGVKIALSTGRSFENAQPVIDALECLKGPSIFNGGPDIIDASTGESMFRQTMPVDSLRKLFELSKPFGYKIFTDADHYQNNLQSQYDIRDEAAQFFVEAVRHADAMRMEQALKNVSGVGVHLASSWAEGDVYDIHVTHENATKQHGVEWVMHHYGIGSEGVMAIGDGFNDIPMLNVAGFKVVMGNASEPVRAIADYVAPSLEDDGAAEAIEKFICGMAGGR